MLTVRSDVHRHHHGLELSGGTVAPSTESPDRAERIAAAVIAAGHPTIEPDELDRQLLHQVHTAEYLELLETAWDRWQQLPDPGPAAMGFTWPARGLIDRRPDDLIGRLGYHSFTADCSIVAGTWDAVSTAAAIATTAADRLIDGGAPTFALCRPPGHHATADQFGGYCYLNNAALAAQRLLNRGAERVAVLDVDYHHGNGTQSIFYDRSDVLFVSLHADPAFDFPWFLGRADEAGIGDGDGWNLNLPLPRGTTGDRFNEALTVALERIRDGRVDGVVVSLGVDIFVDDPLGTFAITTPEFRSIGAAIAGLDIPTTIVQEGGYAVDAIGRNVVSFLDGWS
ncbi:MAG: histone deacetylase family protein [Actinomycetota bacterium]